ncbi:type IV secretion system protein VirB5 [Bartonella phoceensis]|uniref:type IV secretion system protein VirB5 n=1 Tax=Bartonella phoceensis TaxID=270249 RepID=UPI001ABB7B05|nr:type IV secretion system protein VirB5 [Bartonella phoceensis]
MKKYGLVTLLSLAFISHAVSQTTTDVDEYYKNALEGTPDSGITKSETAESIYSSAVETVKKIAEIRQKLEAITSKEKVKPEELQALQTQLSILQTNLQADSVKLQSLNIIQSKDSPTRDEVREAEVQKRHEDLAEKLRKELENSDVKL